MNDTTFEYLVSQALDSLPQVFLNKLENVEVVIESWPSPVHLQAIGAHPQTLLLGLYQGVPQTKRTLSVHLPDKITIFSGPIMAIAHNETNIPEIITNVVKHEIAHHFGMSEADLSRKHK